MGQFGTALTKKPPAMPMTLPPTTPLTNSQRPWRILRRIGNSTTLARCDGVFLPKIPLTRFLSCPFLSPHTSGSGLPPRDFGLNPLNPDPAILSRIAGSQPKTDGPGTDLHLSGRSPLKPIAPLNPGLPIYGSHGGRGLAVIHPSGYGHHKIPLSKEKYNNNWRKRQK